MAFTSLEKRLADLPLILAGPSLRKVTAPTATVTDSSVTVWVALTKRAEVTLSASMKRATHRFIERARNTRSATWSMTSSGDGW